VRILHTSDWHLGRSFHGQPMLAHQAAFVDHLLEVVAAEEVDLVVVSGDVYDRALPPVDAVALAEDALVRLAASRARVVLTSGNHDSHQRLGFASRLIDAAGVHVRTHARDVGAPVLLEDRHGSVAVYGLPYLDPDHLREPWDLPGRSHEAALGEALRRVRADLAARPRETRSVVLAHAFVAGAEPSDSERDISVGGVQAVPTALFDGFCYTALGHLHGRHRLTDAVRYSGSPLAYSFSEAAHRKGCWLVDLDATGLAGAEFVDAPVPRPLSRLRGTIDELLTDRRFADAERAWVQVVLTDAARPGQAKPRLERRFPHLLSLAFEPSGGPAPVVPAARPGSGLGDHDIALAFVRDLRGRPADDAESALLQAACDACCDDTELDDDVVA
jgi:exonuclease SbcD